MATDSTNIPQGELNFDAGSDMAGNELEFGAVQVAQVTADGGQPVQLPQGQRVVLVPVQPGQTLTLPTDSPSGLLAKIGPEGNLAIVVDGRTIILQGYVNANDQSPVRIVTTDGEEIDVADVVAATDPTLNIQTAAGPATGDTGDGAGNGIFVPFQAGPGPGLIDAEGVLGATALQYRLIDDEREEFVQDEDTSPSDIEITFDLLGGIVNEDDLEGDALIIERDENQFSAALIAKDSGGNNGVGNDPFDTTDREDQNGTPDDTDGVDDNGAGVDDDREPLETVATVKVTFGDDIPGTLTVDDSVLPVGLKSEGEDIIYEVLPPSGGQGNGIVAFVDNDKDGKYNEFIDRLVFDIKVQEDKSDSEFHVVFTLYDNIDNTAPDANEDGAADLLGADEQILGLPVKLTAEDSDGSTLSTVMNLGVEDDIPFFGEVVIGEGIEIVHTDAGVTHDESPFPQWDADDQSVFDPSASGPAFAAGLKVLDAGFSLPYGDSVGSLFGIAQKQVFASFGADQATQEHFEPADSDARNSIFGALEDQLNADGDGLDDGENERPFELFMIATGGGAGAVPTEFDNPNTPAVEVANLTIADQKTNTTVTWNGVELSVFVRQIDAQTIVGYVIPEVGEEEPPQEARQAILVDEEGNGLEAVFVLTIDDQGMLTFVQYHQINHDVDGPTHPDHDDDFQILGEDGTPIIQVRISDYDGDHATQPVNLVIQDDGPCFIKTWWGYDNDSTNPFNGTGLIDEDKLSPNGNNDFAPGDDKGGTHADGTVFFDFGVDKPGTLSVEGLTIKDSAGNVIAKVNSDGSFDGLSNLRTADGRAIEIQVSGPDGNGVLTWTAVVAAGEDGAGDAVFKLTIDTEGGNLGDFDFDLYQPIEHPWHDLDSKNDGPLTSYEDNLNFDFTVRGTDVDGDWADGHIKIKVDDDSPVATCDVDCVVEGTHGEGELNFATGNVVTGTSAFFADDANGLDGNDDHPGADQPYVISKLAHGTDTYNLVDNGDGTFSVTKNGGNPLGAGESFDNSTGVLTIPTDQGGTFEIVLVSSSQDEVGDYKYTVPEFADHDHDVHAGPETPAESMSADFDQVSEWTDAFAAEGITLVPTNGSLAIKSVNVSGPEYRGIGVGGGGDETEVDNNGPDQTLTLLFANPTDNAKLTLGALYDGVPDAGFQEILLWQVFDAANVLVASGQILGSSTGLVPLDIDTGGVDFTKIVLTPIDNGAGNSGNNSDFLLLNVETCCPKDKFVEEFDYTLQDADGDESTATLKIDVKDTQPTVPGQSSGGLEIIVDEDGLNPAGTLKDGIGDVQPGDADEGDAGPDDGKVSGTIPFTAGADPVTIELTVGNGGDTGLETVDGKNIFAAWDAEEKRLVGYIEGTDPDEAANQIFVMQITDEQTGAFTFTLKQPIEHPDFDGQENGDNENIPDPYFIVNVQIEDKDCDVAYTQVKVTIDDDMPVVSISADSAGTTQHDETAGRQTDSGDDDQNGNPPALFNVLGAGPAIGWAHDGDSVVQINTARYGADGPGFATYSLGIPAGNVDSGVDTTDGKSVWLFQGPNGIIVGRAGAGADGSTPDANGQIIFAVSIDSDGELTVVQYDSLKHPDNPNNYDEDIGLNTSALQVKLTLTDADDDSATGSANIGNLVRFDDDGPKAKVEATGHSVQHDETADVQNPGSGADRDQFGDLPDAFSGIAGTLIGWARSDSSVVTTAGSSAGADDEGATTTLKVQVAFSGVDSGIDDTATGQNILLYQNGDRVEGRVGGSGGAVAFAVTINSNGTLDVAQYRALEHPNTNDHDEDVQINNSALKVVYTIIDGDGDKATDEVDIGNAVHFDDDGPTANLTEVSGAQIVLDESVGVATGFADPNANDEAGNVANDIGYAKVSGASLFTDTSVFGQDGPAAANSKVFGLGISSSGTNTGLDDVATGQDIRLYQVDADTVEGRVGSSGGAVAFRIDINTSTGEVTISQFRAIEHDNAGSSAADHDESASPEIMDTNKLFLTLTVTDRDLDKSTDSIDLGKLIKFEDDGPVANADVDSVTEDGITTAIGNVYTGANNTAFGSDANTDDGVADDIGSDGAASPTVKWVEAGAPGGFDGNGSVAGLYGTLFVNAAGDYKYVLTNDHPSVAALNDGQTLEETFSYVITDKDGDTATATLKITINGHSDQLPPTASGATAIVDEDGLAAGIGDAADGDDNADLPPDTVAGEATFHAATLPVNWNGEPGDITLTAGVWTGLKSIAGNAIVPDLVNSTANLLIGIDSVTLQKVFEIQIINETTGEYEVRLLQAMEHPDSNNNNADDATDNGTDSFEDNLTIPVNVAYSNSVGTANATINIVVDDDSPTAELIAFSFEPNGNGKLVHDETAGVQDNGNSVNDPQASGEDEDDVATRPAAFTDFEDTDHPALVAIGYASSQITVSLTDGVDPNAAYGADGPGTLDLKLTKADGSDFDGEQSSLRDTETSNYIFLFTEDGIVVGRVGADATAAESGPIAFALSLSDDGSFDLAQYRAIQHPNPATHDESVTLLAYNPQSPTAPTSALVYATAVVTDEDGDAVSKSIPLDGQQGNPAIVFQDDGPVANDDPVELDPQNTGTADIVFIVDVSGSMTNGGGSIVIPGVPDFSDDRLGLARFSMRELLTNHPEILNVQFIKFDNDLSSPSSVWLTRAAALAYINDDANFVGGGNTNYDVALQEAINIYDASVRPAGEADQTLVYFLSDGAPNTANDPGGDAGITNNGTGNDVSIAEWEAFVGDPANNITNVFAIGLGSANVGNLEPIAYPNTDTDPADGDEDRVVIIPDSNITELTQTLDDLLGSVLPPAAGDVLANDTPGADGYDAPELVSVTYDAVTYTFDPATQFNIDLGVGRGSLLINDDGTYTYTPPAGGVVDGTPFYVEYTIRDGDGDTSTAKLLIDLNGTPLTDLNGALGGDDVVIAFSEQTSALIAPTATISDDDATLASMTVTLTNRPNGDAVESLSLNGAAAAAAAGLTVTYVAATGVLTITGSASVATYQTILNGILYNNTSDAPDTTPRNVTVVVNDGTSDSVANTVTVNVTPLNDAPDANITPASYNAAEQTNLNLHGTGLSISDVDAGNGTVSITLSVGFGNLTLSAGNSGVTIGVGNGTSSVTVTGTVTQINNLLGGIDTGPGVAGTIVYNANGDAPPANTTLTLTVNDNGNTGGGNQSDFDTATINIAPSNDAPTTNAGSGSGNEDAASIAVSLSGADVDGTVASFRITSLPAGGTLYADIGLTIALAVNSTVTAAGNAATVYFVPNANFNGSPTFQYAAIDNNGAQDGTPATATITVASVNDLPSAVDDILILRDVDADDSDNYTIQSAWLLRNDTDGDAARFISQVDRTGLDDPATIINGATTNFVIDPDGGDNFTYKASDGSDTDQATVDVQNDGSGSFDGDVDSEIIVGTAAGETLNGNGGNDVLFGGGGNDTLNGGDNDDWLVYDTADGTIDGGADFDVLRFESAQDINIDDDTGGSSFNFVNRVDNIEAIDLRNGSASDDLGNTGGDDTISAADVIAITDTDNVLYIMGEGDGGEGGAADDEVRLDGSWTNNGSVTVNDPAHADINGLTFVQYTSGGATLFIQNTIDVDN